MKKKIVQNKSYENSYDYKQCKVWEARSQKFAIEGLFRRSGGRAPKTVIGWNSNGQSPQPPEAIGGLGAEPPALENFAFFLKNNLVLGLYW